ncbi:uncharacterized protein TNCV_2591891 [Trichonephila clavipes]|nr:uncharacterized protein TNCV_2591891 [Trichonephila clavipes]
MAAVAEWYRYQIVACLVTSLSPVPLKTRRVEQRCMLNLSRAETRPPVGVAWKLGEGVPAQVSPTSLDHGSKLRGPSPKALVLLNSATLIFNQSILFNDLGFFLGLNHLGFFTQIPFSPIEKSLFSNDFPTPTLCRRIQI